MIVVDIRETTVLDITNVQTVIAIVAVRALLPRPIRIIKTGFVFETNFCGPFKRSSVWRHTRPRSRQAVPYFQLAYARKSATGRRSAPIHEPSSQIL